MDFAERVELRAIGKRALENLAKAGAFDGLCASRAQCLAAADLLLRYSAQAAEERTSDQGALFAIDAAPALEKPKLPLIDDWTPQMRLDEECAAVGYYFSGHPLDDYERELKRLNVVSYAEAVERAKSAGRAAYQLAGAVRTVRVRRSKSGNPFAWVELSDPTGEFEVTVFSETLNAARDLLEAGQLVLLSATAEDRDGDVRWTCEAVRSLDKAAAASASQLRVAVSSEHALEGVKRRLKAVKSANPREGGKVIVAMRLARSGRDVEITLPGEAACTPAMRGALKGVDGVTDVELI